MKCKIIINTTNELIIPKFEDFEKEVDNTQIPLIDNFIWVLMEDNGVYKLSPYRTKTEYMGILKPSLRIDVDLSKAVQEKFNEVSERVGCSLRIENNEVVRRETEKINGENEKTIEFKIEKGFEYSGKCGIESWQIPTIGTIKTITIQNTNSTINKNITLSVSENDEIKVSVNPKMTDEETQENSNRMEKYKSSAKQIASNWIGTNKISNTTRAKIEDLIEKDILDIKKSIDSESGKVSDVELIVNAALMGVKFGDAAKLKVDLLIKNDLEEFKKAVESCRIPKEQREQLFIRKSFLSDIGGVLNEMVRWKLFRNYAEIYPLGISRNTIENIFSFNFQGIDDGKQYLFYHAKRIFLAKDNMNLRVVAIAQSNIFDYFSKQLGTKIVGMLINGSKENTKLNPGDLIQFYDDRNVLYNFRLVKSSDKNVEVSLS